MTAPARAYLATISGQKYKSVRLQPKEGGRSHNDLRRSTWQPPGPGRKRAATHPCFAPAPEVGGWVGGSGPGTAPESWPADASSGTVFTHGDSAPVVPPLPGRPRYVLAFLLLTKVSTDLAVEDTAAR
jgi:hypothetical protein